jgi:tetratricopeptide (TPR) repeat protein
MKNPLKSAYPLIIILLIGCIATTLARNGIWHDDTTLWHDVVQKSSVKRPAKHVAYIYQDIGRELISKHEYDLAIERLHTAISLKPDYAKAYYFLGTAYNGKGDYAQAVGAFEKAAALDPDFKHIRFELGRAYGELGRYDDSIRMFNEVIKAHVDPDLDAVYNNLGLCYFRKDDYRRALEQYGRAITINPSFADAYFNRGEAFYKLGKIRKTVADLGKACDLGLGKACRVKELMTIQLEGSRE